ncbi:hypothetical protein KDK95_05935 [Actinospica sp. MGRD01-02]|uniref:Uncharacterized protein n=1 Tax=Actinospica acidithermotolerans TaxID=2828514 RepID=A0A941E698_9ACTN|nr:hypothetical protein [Actinospica acidithermotolerans]MBR7825841.1 hypothetical protein [Actinospica acidithermotolerans]
MTAARDAHERWVVAGEWATSVDDDGRVLFASPAARPELPDRTTAREIEEALGRRDMQWIRALSAAGSAAVLHARGHTLRELAIGAGGWRVARDAAPDSSAAEHTAFALAGPTAAEAYLARRYLRDPLRITACWVLGVEGLITLPDRFAPPALLLCGAGARAPHSWTGRAVHADHIHFHVQGFLEENRDAVLTLAQSLFERRRLTRRRITALLGPRGANLAVLGPRHPMFQATAIDPRAIHAAAQYWAQQLRACLIEIGRDSGADDGLPRFADRVIEAGLFQAFTAAAAEEIGVRIERRTPPSLGGLRRETSCRTSALVYRVGLENYNVPAALSAACDAVGLPDAVLVHCTSPAVELGADGAFLATDDPRPALWTPHADATA